MTLVRYSSTEPSGRHARRDKTPDACHHASLSTVLNGEAPDNLVNQLDKEEQLKLNLRLPGQA